MITLDSNKEYQTTEEYDPSKVESRPVFIEDVEWEVQDIINDGGTIISVSRKYTPFYCKEKNIHLMTDEVAKEVYFIMPD